MRLTSIRRRWRRRPEIFRRRWSVATPVGLHPSYVATDHRRFLTTNPGGTPLIIRGKLFRQPRPALGCEDELIAFHAPEARTLGGFTQIYAGNPPPEYAEAVGRALGCPLDTQIS